MEEFFDVPEFQDVDSIDTSEWFTGPEFPSLDQMVMISSDFLGPKGVSYHTFSGDVDTDTQETCDIVSEPSEVFDDDSTTSLEEPPYVPLPHPSLISSPVHPSQLLNSFVFNPCEFNLYPQVVWPDEEVAFTSVSASHFKCKSNRNVKFEHKLWNALQITTRRPDLYPAVGVMWVSDTIIQVNRVIFGNLLGLEKSTSALFNMQGSFPTHGFTELTLDEVRIVAGVKSTTNDFDECRFFVRKDGKFTRHSKEADVMACTYQKPPALVWV